jgi:hypothetical protein
MLAVLIVILRFCLPRGNRAHARFQPSQKTAAQRPPATNPPAWFCHGQCVLLCPCSECFFFAHQMLNLLDLSEPWHSLTLQDSYVGFNVNIKFITLDFLEYSVFQKGINVPET